MTDTDPDLTRRDPHTTAERDLVAASRAVWAEQRAAGVSPEGAWQRATDLVDRDLVSHVLRDESADPYERAEQQAMIDAVAVPDVLYVERLRAALRTATGLLDDARCALHDPSLAMSWGRDRKRVRTNAADLLDPKNGA